jgi:hypothetical protein
MIYKAGRMSRLLNYVAGGLSITLAFVLTSCNLSRGAVYSTVSGDIRLKIVSGSELDMTEGDTDFVCRYTLNKGVLRVILSKDGSSEAKYFDIYPHESNPPNTTLYSEKDVLVAKENEKKKEVREAEIESIKEAIKRNDLDALARLSSDATNDEISVLLNDAIEDMNVDAVKYLLTRCVDQSQINYAEHMLIIEVDSAHLYDDSAHRNDRVQKIAILLCDHKADINASGYAEQTLLMAASENGLTDLVKLLVSRGAKVDLKNENGETAAALAAKKGYNEIVDVLNNKAR